MTATTAGLSYGRDNNKPWQESLEYYLQLPEEPADKFGALQNLTLVPDMQAVVMRFHVDL